MSTLSKIFESGWVEVSLAGAPDKVIHCVGGASRRPVMDTTPDSLAMRGNREGSTGCLGLQPRLTKIH